MFQSRTRVVSVLMLAVAAVIGLSQAALAQEGPFGAIHVAANRSQYTGNHCPTEIIYTATINFTWPHPRGFIFNYHWERNDGGKSAVRVARPPENQRSLVIHESWRLGAPGKQYDASMRLFVNSGNTHLEQTSPVVRVTCR